MVKNVKTAQGGTTAMGYTDNLILVCAGRDSAVAMKHGLPVLHLCLGLTEKGALKRLQLPTVKTRCLIGLSDPPKELQPCSAERIAADLVFEAKRVEALGVFADFERDTPQSRSLLNAFDLALNDAGLPFYVPVSCGRHLRYAVLTTSTALSGGSLSAHVAQLQSIYGRERIAAFLQPVSQDFTLPSNTPDGINLNEAQRNALLQRTHSQTFFSRELCAKYFTYTGEDGRAHFVLFDDVSTLEAKLVQLSRLGVPSVFALFPDAEPLLNKS